MAINIENLKELERKANNPLRNPENEDEATFIVALIREFPLLITEIEASRALAEAVRGMDVMLGDINGETSMWRRQRDAAIAAYDEAIRK